MRTRLSDVSIETIGFDIAELPSMGDDGFEADFEVSANDSTFERHPSSATTQRRDVYAVMYAQSAAMRELEQLILAFDALEVWTDCLDDFQKCVAPDHIRLLAIRTRR